MYIVHSFPSRLECRLIFVRVIFLTQSDTHTLHQMPDSNQVTHYIVIFLSLISCFLTHKNERSFRNVFGMEADIGFFTSTLEKRQLFHVSNFL